MKSVLVELPDKLAATVESYVKSGFFDSESDVLLAAISEFVRRNRIDLIEQFALEDIEWAKEEAQRHNKNSCSVEKGYLRVRKALESYQGNLSDEIITQR